MSEPNRIAQFYHRNPAHDISYRKVNPGLEHVVISVPQGYEGAREALDRFLGLSAGTDRFYGEFIVRLGDELWNISVKRPAPAKPIIQVI